MKKLFLFAVIVFSTLASCNDKPASTDAESKSMSTATTSETKEERNKKIVMESIDHMLSGNVDEMLKDITPDAVDYGDGSMPVIKGMDSIKSGVKMWLSSVKDYKADNLMAFADGDYVLVNATWSGTFAKDFMGMKTAGKSFKVPDVDIFKLNDEGKITEHRGVQSFNTILSQAGVQMPPHQAPK